MIPARHHRTVPSDHSQELYRKRNIVERGIGWPKQCRRWATRFEKTASSDRQMSLHPPNRSDQRRTSLKVRSSLVTRHIPIPARFRSNTSYHCIPASQRRPQVSTIGARSLVRSSTASGPQQSEVTVE